MVLNTRELLNAVAILTDEENMRTTLKESGKGALVCATSCFLGGLIAGPIGLALGGTLGGVSAAVMSKDKFKPVSEIIRNDLSPNQKQQLQKRVLDAIRNIELADAALLLPLLLKDNSIKMAVLNTVKSFITNEMRLQIVD